MGVKVTVVGGGSTYTPELVEGFVNRSDRLPVDELALLDIDAARPWRERTSSSCSSASVDVNARNDGAIPNLAADAVVEVPARIGRDGAAPLPTEPLALEMHGLVEHAKAYERLAVRAALSGSRTDALKALLSNPLVPGYRTAALLLDALLKANRAHLPRFFSAM